MCDVLGVSTSGYYSFIKQGQSAREQENQKLDVNIKAAFYEHKERYGAPRIRRELKKRLIFAGKERIAKRMRLLDLKAHGKKKFRVTTDSEHSSPVFENVLERNFSVSGANQKWAGDITYIPTKEGWLYLAVIIDLYSRAVIGWSMSDRLKKSLVSNALKMALFRRRFPKNVVVHSDRGSQYCSLEYRKLLENHKLVGSMSRKANCWDNAPSESFFHTLKVELVRGQSFASRDDAQRSIFDYIECYYNRKRMHSSIDYMTPHEKECA